jgi:hypothetical protein
MAHIPASHAMPAGLIRAGRPLHFRGPLPLHPVLKDQASDEPSTPTKSTHAGGAFHYPETPILLSPSLRAELLSTSRSWLLSGLPSSEHGDPCVVSLDGERDEDADWLDAAATTPSGDYNDDSAASDGEESFVPISSVDSLDSVQSRMEALSRCRNAQEFIASVFDEAGSEPGRASDLLDSVLARLPPGPLREQFEADLDEAVLARCLNDSVRFKFSKCLSWG